MKLSGAVALPGLLCWILVTRLKEVRNSEVKLRHLKHAP